MRNRICLSLMIYGFLQLSSLRPVSRLPGYLAMPALPKASRWVMLCAYFETGARCAFLCCCCSRTSVLVVDVILKPFILGNSAWVWTKIQQGRKQRDDTDDTKKG